MYSKVSGSLTDPVCPRSMFDPSPVDRPPRSKSLVFVPKRMRQTVHLWKMNPTNLSSAAILWNNNLDTQPVSTVEFHSTRRPIAYCYKSRRTFHPRRGAAPRKHAHEESPSGPQNHEEKLGE